MSKTEEQERRVRLAWLYAIGSFCGTGSWLYQHLLEQERVREAKLREASRV